MATRHWPRRLGVLAAVCAILTIFPAGAALAHAVFVSASPAPGASLSHPPATVRIVFSEPLVAALSSVKVDASSGAGVHERYARVDAVDRSAYEVGLPRLRPDRYTVIWHTTSAVDGHSRWGSYVFTVLGPGGAQPRLSGVSGSRAVPREPSPLPTSVQAAGSWLGLAGLFLVTGAILMLLLGGAGSEPARRTLGWLLAAGAIAAALGVVSQVAATWSGDGWSGSALGAVLTDGAVRWWWLRIVAVAVAVAAWPRRARPADFRWHTARPAEPWRQAAGPAWRYTVLIAALGAMCLSFAASGHGAASPEPVAGLAFMVVHVLAASLWLGGVLGLAAVWGLARRSRATQPEFRALVRRYSIIAGMAVPAVAATGAASALLELGSIDDFITSGYGTALLVKLGVAALVGVAALASVLVHRRPDPGQRWARRARVTLWAEASLGLAILVPTAAMSVLGPPRPADAARSATQQIQANTDPAAAFTGDGQFGGRGVELSLTPGTAGPNAVRAEVDGTDPATRLSLRVTGPGGATAAASLRRTGHDHDPQTHTTYQGAVSVGSAGTWEAVVRGPSGASQPVVVPVRAAAAGAQPGSGQGRLSGWLVVIAVVGASVTALAGARVLRRRRFWRASVALGGAGCVAAAGWAGVLAATATAAATSSVPTAWGSAYVTRPTVTPTATTWPVGGSGAGLMMPAVAPDGSVWVGEMDANKIARLRPTSNVVQQVRLPGGYKEIMGLAVDAGNHVWIAEEHAQALGMFDPSTGRYRQHRIPGADPAPVGIAVDGAGNVWFTEMNGDRIGRFDPDTSAFTQFPIPALRALPYWLAAAPGGRVWFTEFGTGMVGALNPASGRIRQYRLPARQSPAGIAIGRGATPWVATIGGSLFRIEPATGRLRRFRSPAASTYGVAVTTDGTVWLGSASGDAAYGFDPATAVFRCYPLPGGRAPWWVAAAGRHRVWVALSAEAAGELGEITGGSGPGVPSGTSCDTSQADDR